jgi:type IV pilus assembly protein PilW
MEHLNRSLRMHRGSSRAQCGMTLVELLVAMLLGLITTYFIAQVFAVAEGQKRTATFGTDAQVNGAVALHTLRRHVMSSGYGVVSAPSALGCPMHGQFGTAGTTTASPAMTLAPLVITAAGSASAPSDGVSVLTSTKSTFAAPVLTNGTHLEADEKAFLVQGGSHGMDDNDTILAVPKGWTSADRCLLLTVKQDTTNPATTASKSRVPHVASPSASSWNATTAADWPAAGFPDGSVLLNFGQMRRMDFRVNGDSFEVLTWTPQGVGAAEQLNSGIVLMKALYGRDTDGDGRVDVYDTTTPTDNAGWRNVRVLRLAMVARSGQREKTPVTTAAPVWHVGDGTAVSYQQYPGAPTVCAANAATCDLPLPISHLNEWQNYRYKVFETAIPVRNLMWNAEEP